MSPIFLRFLRSGLVGRPVSLDKRYFGAVTKAIENTSRWPRRQYPTWSQLSAHLCCGPFRVEAKAGTPRHVILTDEWAAAVRGADSGDDPIFTRADGGTWGKSHQSRPMLEACQRAKIKRAISFHVLRHTHGLSTRRARRSDGRYCRTTWSRRHGHDGAPLCASFRRLVADTIGAHFPTLGIGDNTAIIPISRRK